MVKKAIKERGGQCTIVIENFRPIFEGSVGGDNHRTLFIAMADDLEEHICPSLTGEKSSTPPLPRPPSQTVSFIA
jgi:hypothetical protein